MDQIGKEHGANISRTSCVLQLQIVNLFLLSPALSPAPLTFLSYIVRDAAMENRCYSGDSRLGRQSVTVDGNGSL